MDQVLIAIEKGDTGLLLISQMPVTESRKFASSRLALPDPLIQVETSIPGICLGIDYEASEEAHKRRLVIHQLPSTISLRN